jgi:phage RecT family recombinase
MECTQSSLFQCLLTCAQFGLEPDGRRAHLIPFENRKKKIVECQLIIDYKGLSELVYRSGVVSYLHSDVVRRGDIFDFSKGQLKDHVPHFLRKQDDQMKPPSAGLIYAVYSLARMKDGSEKCEVLALSEVLSIRDGSQGWRAFKAGFAKSSPWDPNNAVSEQEMMKKTAFRRLSKWLPISAEVRDLIEKDDDPIDIVATPARQEGLASLVDSSPAEKDVETVDRDRIIDILKNRILDENSTADAMLKAAMASGIVEAAFDGELFELPTETLIRVAEMKGGSK